MSSPSEEENVDVEGFNRSQHSKTDDEEEEVRTTNSVTSQEGDGETQPFAGMDKLDKEEEGFKLNWTRYIVLALATAALTFVVANPLLFNFTVICMDDLANGTDEHWIESGSKRNLLFSAVAMGNIVGTLPVTTIIQRLGVRHLFLIYGTLSILATTVFPLVVNMPYAVVFIVRFVQGLGMAMALPGLSAVCAVWSPLKEMGLFMAILSLQFQFCAMISMPMGATFCTHEFGWRGAYYVHGLLSLIIFVLFWLFFRDDPAEHKLVSQKELSKVSLGKDGESRKQNVPYLAICKTPVILGVWISSVGGNLGYQMLLQYGPTYLNKVLRFEIQSTGMATALPFLIATVMKLIMGPLSDWITFFNDKQKVIFFTSVSQGFMAVFFVIIALSSVQVLSQLAYSGAIIASSINVIGTIRCAQLVARQFTPFVMSVVNVLMCLIILVLPLVVTTLAGDNTPTQWAVIFYGIVAVIVVTNAYFIFVASADPASWTRDPNMNGQKTSTIQPTSPPSVRKVQESA